MKNHARKICAFLLLSGLITNNVAYASPGDTTLFQLLPAFRTGIQFRNQLTESDSINILNQANVYNGGGVGIGDFNKDGLPDIYFAGNMVHNRLYLNKGNLRFTDVTDKARVGGEKKWCTGVSVVDINGDGWPDIHVSASFRKNPLLRTNLLYIHQGLNKEGIPVFKESATAYGLADTGFSTQAFFLDYDRDNDLDMYLLTNELYDLKTPIRFRPKLTDGSAKNTDRLYRNDGNNHFSNVSAEAGILIEGWGHAASITDINKDGWPDIYVANDFVSNDLLYINNKNGTFTNRLTEYFKHTAWNAMGTDMADLNNDGWVDLVSLEMLPEDNLRKKRMLSGNEYYNYYNSQRFQYSHQYVRNVVQFNKGLSPAGHPVFSEMGYLAGLHETDWSWCPLVADFDNDGLKDIIITNGLPRDVTDLDYISFNNGQGGGKGNFSLSMVNYLPVVKLPNYSFKNVDGTHFSNTSKQWGFTHSSFSNGAAYADLDNDGDLDIVINNINENAWLYENTLNSKQRKLNNWLTILLAGPAPNNNGIGASIKLYQQDRQQYYEQQPSRGYLSTVDNRAHFGLGEQSMVDSIQVSWPDNKTETIRQIRSDQLLTIDYKNAQEQMPGILTTKASLLSKKNHLLPYRHKEKDAIDYNLQPSIPHKLSQYGPGIAVGDIDNNGYEDICIGASVGNRMLFFLQDKDGKFIADSLKINTGDKHPGEDMGLLFFDADNDGDQDLYVVSGSYELAPNHPASQDVLYFNNGSGVFEPRYPAIPKMFDNGSCVKAADFDADGDLDLFVGGRVTSGAYPVAPRSYLLVNDGKGQFTDETVKLCSPLANIGMVTDALFSDFNNDKKPDLVLTGEWMPVQFLVNNGSGFTLATSETGLANQTGWWNSLLGADFDNDGDIDYVAGNLGLNSNYKATEKEPLWLLAKDFDDNGLMDPFVFCYMKANDGSRQLFPMTNRDDMVSQMISIRKKFPTYQSYGLASMDKLIPVTDRDNAMILKATQLSTCYFENKGDGKFRISALPVAAQEAPVYGMLADDIDDDGQLDLLITGNDFGMEPYSGRHDALMGICLKGNGKGNFKPISIAESGFYTPGDGKALVRLANNQRALFLASQNQDSLQVFSSAKPRRWIKPETGDAVAEIQFNNGMKRRVELYYGSGFLSQSSRMISVPDGVYQVIITNYRGESRNLKLE